MINEKSKSEPQRRFFWLVKGVQQNRIPGKRVGDKVVKAARSMSKQDVEDFTKGKNLPKKRIQEMVEYLKKLKNEEISPIEPMYLQEDDVNKTDQSVNPISKTFQQKGVFEQYIQKFSGLAYRDKELAAIHNFTKIKPIKIPDINKEVSKDNDYIRYESTDDFGNSIITVIKKLRENDKLVFVSFQLNKSSQEEPVIDTPADPASNTKEEAIIVKKSIPFISEIEGGSVLGNFLQSIEP